MLLNSFKQVLSFVENHDHLFEELIKHIYVTYDNRSEETVIATGNSYAVEQSTKPLFDLFILVDGIWIPKPFFEVRKELDWFSIVLDNKQESYNIYFDDDYIRIQRGILTAIITREDFVRLVKNGTITFIHVAVLSDEHMWLLDVVSEQRFWCKFLENSMIEVSDALRNNNRKRSDIKDYARMIMKKYINYPTIFMTHLRKVDISEEAQQLLMEVFVEVISGKTEEKRGGVA